MFNKESAAELHKPIVKRFDRMKVHSLFVENIWAAGLTNMQPLTKFNKGICYYVLLIYSVKTHEVIPLKDNIRITITNYFQKTRIESKTKENMSR